MMSVKREYELALIAISFFTRLPIPKSVEFSQKKLNHCSRYFSFVGLIIGVIVAAVFWITDYFLPKEIAVIISMILSLLLTGAFHEDGLADTADGIGGGWTVEQKLKIMKDSRIGTYGALALCSVFILKYQLLVLVEHTAIALIVAHPLSRSIASSIIHSLPYVQEDESTKSKPISENNRISDLLICCAIGVAPTLFLVQSVALLITISFIIFFLAHLYLNKKLKGFTGDALGAVQQVSEIVIYMFILGVS